MSKSVVMSLHGIRTRGAWQKTLDENLSAADMICVAEDYGYLSLSGFLISSSFGGKATWFLQRYTAVRQKYDAKLADGAFRRYPSLVAHSFGTFIAAHSMIKYEEIRFEKMIICGSVLPPDFPWDLLFQRSQVIEVRHEYGMKDVWTTACRFLPHKKIGASGRQGFQLDHPNFTEEPYPEYEHSDFFGESHIQDSWVPFLRKESKRFSVRHGREIERIDDFLGIFETTSQLDHLVFGHLDNYGEIEPSIELAKRWISVEPDVYTFLVDQREGRYVGYINSLFVRPQAIENLIQNGIPDNQMTEEVLASSHEPGPLVLCALAIAVDPSVRNIGQGFHDTHVRTLLNGLCFKLEYYARHRRLMVSEIVAVGWTDEGRRICEGILGMRRVAKDRYGHPIFRLSMALDELKRKKRPFRPLLKVAKLYRELGLDAQ